MSPAPVVALVLRYTYIAYVVSSVLVTVNMYGTLTDTGHFYTLIVPTPRWLALCPQSTDTSRF